MQTNGRAQCELAAEVIAGAELYFADATGGFDDVDNRHSLATEHFFTFRDDRPGLIEHTRIAERERETSGRIEDLHHREARAADVTLFTIQRDRAAPGLERGGHTAAEQARMLRWIHHRSAEAEKT